MLDYSFYQPDSSGPVEDKRDLEDITLDLADRQAAVDLEALRRTDMLLANEWGIWEVVTQHGETVRFMENLAELHRTCKEHFDRFKDIAYVRMCDAPTCAARRYHFYGFNDMEFEAICATPEEARIWAESHVFGGYYTTMPMTVCEHCDIRTDIMTEDELQAHRNACSMAIVSMPEQANSLAAD